MKTAGICVQAPGGKYFPFRPVQPEHQHPERRGGRAAAILQARGTGYWPTARCAGIRLLVFM